MACARDVAQMAATIGREFDYGLLAAVVTLDEETLSTELSKLLAAGILYAIGQPPECVYPFKHVLIEEALYNAIGEPREDSSISKSPKRSRHDLRTWSRRSRNCSRSISREPG